nr:hypothetical protein CFP56_63113 [Quercus suber]
MISWSAELKLRPKEHPNDMQSFPREIGRPLTMHQDVATPGPSAIHRAFPLAHFVLAMTLGHPVYVFGARFVIDGDVQISSVGHVGFAAELTIYDFSYFDGKNIGKVKHSLFPMRVFGVRTSRKADGFVACRELYVEPCNESMDIIGTTDIDVERQFKSQVGRSDGVQIESQNSARIGDHGFELDGID